MIISEEKAKICTGWILNGVVEPGWWVEGCRIPGPRTGTGSTRLMNSRGRAVL
jgi:hypothetical protein